jgi:heme-degrading monooxygenase HmoA
MYARHVSFNLKPNSAKEFGQKVEQDILPLLRKQNGFKDEITLLGEDGKDVVAISLWDRKESADSYSRDTYSEVLKGLATLVEGTPKVVAYEVASSTFHEMPAHA